MKNATVSLLMVALAIAILVGAVIFIFILAKFNIGSQIYYQGCDGQIDGKVLKHNGVEYVLSPKCVLYTEKGQEDCETAYSTYFEDKGTFCIWITGIDPNAENSDLDGDSKADAEGCVANPKIYCDDLTADTVPKCEDVPSCHPVNIIERAIENLK